MISKFQKSLISKSLEQYKKGNSCHYKQTKNQFVKPAGRINSTLFLIEQFNSHRRLVFLFPQQLLYFKKNSGNFL